MGYLEYQKKVVVVASLVGCTCWMSLSTFFVMAKSNIGIENIPIFELIIFVASMVGSRIAYTNILSFSQAVKLDLFIESIFLVAIYIALIKYQSLMYAGLAIYGVIIINAFLRLIKQERARNYEDKELKKDTHKKFLKVIRSKDRVYDTIGGVLGTSIALVALNYFKVDLIQFAMAMLILNVIQNIYEYYITYKYLIDKKAVTKSDKKDKEIRTCKLEDGSIYEYDICVDYLSEEYKTNTEEWSYLGRGFRYSYGDNWVLYDNKKYHFFKKNKIIK